MLLYAKVKSLLKFFLSIKWVTNKTKTIPILTNIETELETQTSTVSRATLHYTLHSTQYTLHYTTQSTFHFQEVSFSCSLSLPLLHTKYHIKQIVKQ